MTGMNAFGTLRDLPSVRQLRAFVAVYQTGQVSTAAEQLALTQPAVTMLVQELEERLGARLFERVSRRLKRTEAAEEVFGRAARALAELEGMRTAVADVVSGRRGRVRIACTSTIAQTILPPVMARFSCSHPSAQLELHDVAPADFVEEVLSGRADVGVGVLEGRTQGLSQDVIAKDPLCAVMIMRGARPNRASMTWNQLANDQVIVVRGGYGVRRRIDEAAIAAGVTLKIVHEVSLLTTAVSMAANGLGVAIAPESLARHVGSAGLMFRRLRAPVVEREIGLIYRRLDNLSGAALALRSELLKVG